MRHTILGSNRFHFKIAMIMCSHISQDLKKQQNLICLVNIRMSVPFRIATFVRFNHFIHVPHCFVLCATNIDLSIIELFIWIDCWQMVLFFLNLFLKNMLLLIRDYLIYGYPLTCFTLLLCTLTKIIFPTSSHLFILMYFKLYYIFLLLAYYYYNYLLYIKFCY